MSAHFEPITGRYMHLDLFGKHHRIYVEEAGEGTPLLCLHTAGSDGRQYRALMNDERVTQHHRVIAFDMPWHGKSSPPAGWHNEEYQLTNSTSRSRSAARSAAASRCIWRSNTRKRSAPLSACRPAPMSIPITT